MDDKLSSDSPKAMNLAENNLSDEIKSNLSMELCGTTDDKPLVSVYEQGEASCLPEDTIDHGVNIGSPFECNVCHKRFTKRGRLNIHFRMLHSGDTPYECNVCGKRFLKKAHLNVHFTKHTDETFECEECHRIFPCLQKLKKHVRGHKLEKILFCDTCDLKFTSKGSLKRHIKRGRCARRAARRAQNV